MTRPSCLRFARGAAATTTGVLVVVLLPSSADALPIQLPDNPVNGVDPAGLILINPISPRRFLPRKIHKGFVPNDLLLGFGATNTVGACGKLLSPEPASKALAAADCVGAGGATLTQAYRLYSGNY